jgi:hypothetical protein
MSREHRRSGGGGTAVRFGSRRAGARRLGVAAAVAIALSACAGGDPSAAVPATPAGGSTLAGTVIEVHRSPTCGCCGDYEDYLAAHGAEVRSVVRDDVGQLKQELGIPARMGSCHTSLVDGYFVEGHVPVSALMALLDSRPAVDGITLPGMPSGSPGMSGDKDEPWIIYSVTDGETREFARE